MSDIYIAVDPSIVGTSVCIGDTQAVWTRRFPSLKPAGKLTCAKRIQRITSVVADVMEWAAKHGGTRARACFIEQYGFASASGNWQAEMGGLLRAELITLTRTIYEFPPTSVKKFTTNKGNADKKEMAASLQSIHDRRFDSHDEADAFAIYAMGLCLLGIDQPKAEYQAAMIDQYQHLVRG